MTAGNGDILPWPERHDGREASGSLDRAGGTEGEHLWRRVSELSVSIQFPAVAPIGQTQLEVKGNGNPSHTIHWAPSPRAQSKAEKRINQGPGEGRYTEITPHSPRPESEGAATAAGLQFDFLNPEKNSSPRAALGWPIKHLKGICFSNFPKKLRNFHHLPPGRDVRLF